MSPEPVNGVEVTRDAHGRWQGKAFGQMVVIVLLLIALGGLVVAQDLQRQRDHDRLADAIEALVWVSLPEPYKSKMAPPKWLRDKLGGSVPNPEVQAK